MTPAEPRHTPAIHDAFWGKDQGDKVPAKSSFLKDAYHGPHVASRRPDANLVDWSPPARRTHRVRVRAHTCDCRRPSYELCAAGGLQFVRRLAADGSITESPWTRSCDAVELWEQILRGQAL